MKKVLGKLTTVVAAFLMICALSMTVETKAAISAPSGLSYKSVGNEATISWGAVSGATSYNIYSAESRYAAYTKVDIVTTTSYTVDKSKYYEVTAVIGNTESGKSSPISYELSTFGNNVYIFEPTDNSATIQKITDGIYDKQEKNQFGSERYALMFKQGTYSNSLSVETGFYTQVAGLGLSPKDTSLGTVNAKAEWMISRKPNGDANFNATCNFWRSAENLSINKDSIWAVSQGTSMRRMNVNGNLYIQQNGGYASGGFLSDSAVSKSIIAWSQQQWLTRNTSCKTWESGVWNLNFVGMESGSAPSGTWPKAPFTTVEKTPIVQDKPFLMINDSEEYGVYVPELRNNAIGTSWKNGVEGEFISIDKFYIAKPGDSAAKINNELASGKNLILTPGIYNVSEPIKVTKANTIVLGLGYATIKPTNRTECMTVADFGGVKIAGILFDAGRKGSNSLMVVGTKGSTKSNAANPIVLSDLYFRVGGADNVPCSADVCLTVNSNDLIGDNFWVWRADHGAGVGWTKNKTKNGVIVNGNNVTMYALMVEHFHEYQTIWNGENGRTYLYQCEIPYDVPSQASWMSKDGQGYAGYYVAPNVKNHYASGLGVYAYFTQTSAFLNKAIIVPDTPNVKITNACTVVLGGKGGIDNVVNNSGAGILTSGEISRVISYCNGKAVTEGKDAKKYITMAEVKNVTSKRAYTGKKITFKKLKLVYRNVTLRKGIDYTVSYKNNKKIGKATITIKGKGMFKATKKIKFKIIPARVVVKAKAYKKKLKISYKKVKGAARYEIVYSKNKRFKKKTLVTTKKTKLTIKKLESRKKYYIKVRAYKKVKGKKVYGRYSKAVKRKIK